MEPDMTEPTYRYAQKADTPALVALIECAYRGEDAVGKWTSEAHLLKGPRTNDKEIEGLIAREETRFLIAEIDGKLVGCCLLQGLPPEPDARINAAYFGMFAINPEIHGGGLGKKLIAEAEKRVQDLWRCNQMVMTVINVRTALIEWYERRGYRLTGATLPFPFSESTGETTRDFHLAEMRKTLT
jgi:ribosomal protein S18 acetylase RimI-like enzyme